MVRKQNKQSRFVPWLSHKYDKLRNDKSKKHLEPWEEWTSTDLLQVSAALPTLQNVNLMRKCIKQFLRARKSGGGGIRKQKSCIWTEKHIQFILPTFMTKLHFQAVYANVSGLLIISDVLTRVYWRIFPVFYDQISYQHILRLQLLKVLVAAQTQYQTIFKTEQQIHNYCCCITMYILQCEILCHRIKF